MAVTFSLIPSDAKLPLFYAEVSSTAALSSASVGFGPSLIIGQGIGTGFTAGVPVRIYSIAQANTLFRPGSQIARMIASYFANDSLGELWALPYNDATGTPATKTINLTGTSPAYPTTLTIYVGGQKAAIPIAASQTAAQVATAIETFFGVDEAAAAALGSTYPVIAVATSAAVAFTARNDGTSGNGISLWLNYGGVAAGEALPTGIAITEFASANPLWLATGATDPALTTLAAQIGQKRFSFIAHPWSRVKADSLDLFKTVMADSSTGRWGPTSRYYGHTFSARVDISDAGTVALTSSDLANDPHASVFGIQGTPTWEVEIAAAFCARAAGSARALASRPLNTLELIGVKPVKPEYVWSYATRASVLDDGYTVPMASSDDVRLARAVSTYRTNAYGTPDPAYLDVTTLFNLDYQLSNMEAEITTKYPRHILVNDGTNVGPGVPAVTPNAIRNCLIALYKRWERLGLVENAATFAANLIVERDETDPNRVNVLYPPDLANGLHVFAVLNEFRLQYAEAV